MTTWLSTPVRYRWAAAWILGSITVVSILAVPLKVTVDGVFYLASAKSLFTPDFSWVYAYFREPGYPLMIKLVHLLGNDGIILLAVQALCLGAGVFIAGFCLLRALRRPGFSRGHLIIVVVLALNPMYLIYAGLILQQALFTLQLGLFALGISLALDRPPGLRRWVLLLGVGVNYAAAIWTSIGWIYLALVPVVLTVVLVARGGVASLIARTRRVGLKIVTVIASVLLIGFFGIALYQGALATYAGWEAVKAPYESHARVPGSVIQPLSTTPPIPTPALMAERMLALMHIGTIEKYPHENDLFLRQQMVSTNPRSQYDTAYVFKPYTSYAVGYVALPNASLPAHYLYSIAAKIAPAVYDGAFVAFMTFVIAAIVRRRWRALIVLIAPIGFLAVYAASNSPIDRYGIPAYPWAVVSAALLIGWIAELVAVLRPRKAGGALRASDK